MDTIAPQIDTLNLWESRFQEFFLKTSVDERKGGGALLPLIPYRTDWEQFLEIARLEWPAWLKNLQSYPICLVVLYSGIAFFEYDRKFWPQFSKAIGKDHLTQNQYNKINDVFVKVSNHFNLPLHQDGDRTSYVGSAVYFIGVPLSLWEGFLNLCYWAVYHPEWKSLTAEQWNDAVVKCSGNKTRLRDYLLENRQLASKFVQEMLDARVCLSEDESFSISNIRDSCLLRPEYFDEVPETAEFLRPNNPDSLIKDRPHIFWDDRKHKIVMQLPAIIEEKLPAKWSTEHAESWAASNATEMAITDF